MSADGTSSGRRRSIDDPDSLIASTSPAAAAAPQQQSQLGAPAPSSDAAGGDDDDDADEAEIAAMRARVAEMEAEAQKLREMTAASEAAANGGAASGASGAGANGGGDGAGGEDVNMSDEDRAAVDARSIYVGNVSRRPFLPLGRPRLSGLSVLERERGLTIRGLAFARRWTMARRRKRSSSTLPRAGPSTASRSSLTSLPVRKGQSSRFRT